MEKYTIKQIEKMIKSGEDKEKIKVAILSNPTARKHLSNGFMNQGKVLEAMLAIHHPEMFL